MMTIYDFIDKIILNHDGYNEEIIEYCGEQEYNDIRAALVSASVKYSTHTDLRTNVGNRHIFDKANITDHTNITYIRLGV